MRGRDVSLLARAQWPARHRPGDRPLRDPSPLSPTRAAVGQLALRLSQRGQCGGGARTQLRSRPRRTDATGGRGFLSSEQAEQAPPAGPPSGRARSDSESGIRSRAVWHRRGDRHADSTRRPRALPSQLFHRRPGGDRCPSACVGVLICLLARCNRSPQPSRTDLSRGTRRAPLMAGAHRTGSEPAGTAASSS